MCILPLNAMVMVTRFSKVMTRVSRVRVMVRVRIRFRSSGRTGFTLCA